MPATTHWAAVPGMKRAFPRVQVQTGVRFVDTGRIVTTAGVSAGIDGALHVVQRLLGDDVAWETARYMQYVWEPQESARLSRPAKEALGPWCSKDAELANRLLTAAVAAKARRTPFWSLVSAARSSGRALQGRNGQPSRAAVALGETCGR